MKALPYFDPIQRHSRQHRSMNPGTMAGTVLSARPYKPKPRFSFTDVASSFPTPWAWYRGDDLDDSVSTWPDRQGDRDLTPSGDTPTYTTDAVGGHPGIVGTDSDGALTADYTAETSGDVTICVVTAGVTETPGADVQVLDASGVRLGEFIWWDGGQQVFAKRVASGNGGAITAEPMPGAHWLIADRSTSQSRIWLDGTLLATETEAYVSVDHAHVEVHAAIAGTTIAEVIIWDRVLTDAERGEVDDYITDRYGL